MDVVSELNEARVKIEKGDRQSARSTIRNVIEEVENRDKRVAEYSNKILASKLGMAEAGVNLGNTYILEDVISEVNSHSEIDKLPLSNYLKKAEKTM